MFKVTEFNVVQSCDQCGIDLLDNLSIDDVNNSKNRYHLCQDCQNKIHEYGGEQSPQI